MAQEEKEKKTEPQKTFGDTLAEKGYPAFYEVAEFEDLGLTPNGEVQAIGLKNVVGVKLPALLVSVDRLLLFAEAMQKRHTSRK